MVQHQGPRRHAAVQIIVHGMQDVTSTLHPYLISVQVIDSLEGDHDQCNIELDDRNAELQLPPDGVSLQVAMGWSGQGPRLPDRGRQSVGSDGKIIGQGEMRWHPSYGMEQPWGGPGMKLVFSGVVSSVESGFGRRGGGRRVWIEATSGNVKGLGKEPQTSSKGAGNPDDSNKGGQGGSGGGGSGISGGAAGSQGGEQVPLNTFMQEIFGKAGMQVKLSPEMMKLTNNYWSVNGQSPLDFGKAIAKEVGGFFKVANGVATLVGKGEGTNADGDDMPTIEAIWGWNLIGWRIKPYAGRPQYGQTMQKFFDIHEGGWDKVQAAIGGMTPFGAASAMAGAAAAVTDKWTGTKANKGVEGDVTSRRGTGWILLNGEPDAKAGAHIHIDDARPGVDGRYLMTEVEHNYQRGVGFTTRCNVQYPEPDAGGYGWKNDPGKFDPNAKTPKPPISAPTVFTDEEKTRMRIWYWEHGMVPPDWLGEASQAEKDRFHPPSEPGQAGEGGFEFPEGPQRDDIEPGQAGEGGITFPD